MHFHSHLCVNKIRLDFLTGTGTGSSQSGVRSTPPTFTTTHAALFAYTRVCVWEAHCRATLRPNMGGVLSREAEPYAGPCTCSLDYGSPETKFVSVEFSWICATEGKAEVTVFSDGHPHLIISVDHVAVSELVLFLDKLNAVSMLTDADERVTGGVSLLQSTTTMRSTVKITRTDTGETTDYYLGIGTNVSETNTLKYNFCREDEIAYCLSNFSRIPSGLLSPHHEVDMARIRVLLSEVKQHAAAVRARFMFQREHGASGRLA